MKRGLIPFVIDGADGGYMMNKSSSSDHISEAACVQNGKSTIRGRIVDKEDKNPISELIVHVYWVDMKGLHGEHTSWHKDAHENRSVSKAGSTESLVDGTFTLTINRERAIGESSAIGLIVTSPDDQTLYTFSTPKLIGEQEMFIIRIKRDLLIKAKLLPATQIELLEKAEGEKKDINEWNLKQRIKSDRKIRKLEKMSKAAFENFCPSILPASVRKAPNYLAEGDDLKKTLKKVRNKALKKVGKENLVKTRRIHLSDKSIDQLDLKKKEEVTIPASKLAETLKSERISVESNIEISGVSPFFIPMLAA